MPWVTGQIQTAIVNARHIQERSKTILESIEFSIPFPTQYDKAEEDFTRVGK